MTHLDRALGIFEQGLNWAGYVPLLSHGSGALRMWYGQTEVICSLGLAAITALGALFNSDVLERHLGVDRAAEIVNTYTLHGIANVGRGAIEACSILYFIPVSWFTCLPYDYSGNRFCYPREGERLFGFARTRQA